MQTPRASVYKLTLLLILSLSLLFLLIQRPNLQDYQNQPELLPSVDKQPPQKINLILTGDVMLGRSVMKKSLEVNDPIYPFRKVAERLKAVELVFINLENPIVKNCPPHEGGFKFCTTPEIAEGLKFAGVDVVTLANNHSRNYGNEGILETKKFLEDQGILVTGLNNLAIRKINNTTFGFLGFDFTVNTPTEADFELIGESNSKVDVLIVGVHWGVEYTDKPQDYQREWAKKMVEAGADVISGHHPHWVQISDYIAGKPVYYSLGNFIFDQMWSEETKKGLAVELSYEDGKFFSINEHPTYINSVGQPAFSAAYLGE